MAVRNFSRSAHDQIGFLNGSMPALGPITTAAIIKKNSDVGDYGFIINALNGADPNNWDFYIDASNHLTFWTGSTDLASTFTVLASEGWVFVAGTKASGTVGAIFYKCVLSTGHWTIDSITTATSANSGLGTSASFVGGNGTATTNHFDGRMYAIGVWNTVKSQSAIQALAPGNFADLNALIASWDDDAAVLWRLDQASTGTNVTDLSTNASANQNSIQGTSVVTGDDPPFGILEASSQILVPTSTVAAGSYTPSTGATLYGVVDETTADDADYVLSGASPSSADIMILGIDPGNDPGVDNDGANYKVKYRLGKNITGGDTINVTVRLMQGNTEIASWSENNVDALTTQTRTLTNAQANAITNHQILRVEFDAVKG